MSTGKVWVGSGLHDAAGPHVSIFDHGFTVGDGVFEAVKVVDGEPFALTRHLDRLAASAAGMGLPPVDEALVRRAVAETLAANPRTPLARIRITYTAGPAPLGSERGSVDGLHTLSSLHGAPGSSGSSGPTLAVAVGPVTPHQESTAVATVPWVRNERGALAGLKTTSYGENALALARAREAGASEALFADTTGRLCEGTGSNVFVVIGGRILTPTLATGCLAGVTRALVLKWVEDAAEEDMPPAVLREAEEIFLTSTLRDVQGVHRVDDRELPAPGPVTKEVMAVFAEHAAVERDPH